jgi:molybdopterin-binding protein
VNDATLPGLVTPAGTVHANEYVPLSPGVAVIVAAVPSQTVDELTVTVHGCAYNFITASIIIIAILISFFIFDNFQFRSLISCMFWSARTLMRFPIYQSYILNSKTLSLLSL